MTRRLLKGEDLDYSVDDIFAKIYQKVDTFFKSSAAKHNLTHAAMIDRNGNSVIVRYDEGENTKFNGEIISFRF